MLYESHQVQMGFLVGNYSILIPLYPLTGLYIPHFSDGAHFIETNTIVCVERSGFLPSHFR